MAVEVVVVDSLLGILLSLLGGVGSVCWEVATFWVKAAYDGIITPIHERRHWRLRLTQATNYGDWARAAAELDRIEGKSNWKKVKFSKDYDFELVQTRMRQLQSAREMEDEAALAFLLRTSLARNFGGIDNGRLFEKSRIGTKNLIEKFNTEIITSLELLASGITDKTSPVELKIKMDLFKDLRHELGNTALLLSGGASLGVYHLGVIKALLETGLLPRIIAGASAGSVVAAISCCRPDSELLSLLSLEGIDLNLLEAASSDKKSNSWTHFWQKKLTRFICHGVIFDGDAIKKCLREIIGDVTFLESYRITNRVLNISVSSTTMYDMPRLLNYITSPNVLVWSAVVASCALPALFDAAPLLAKDHKGQIVPWNVTGDRWMDGSVENDLPMNRLAELFNVNHFIVSQVNIHVYPFLKHMVGGGTLTNLGQKIVYLVVSEIKYRLDQAQSLGIAPRTCQILKSILDQKYYGDITIIPDIAWCDIISMLADRPREAMLEAIKRGEKATWPEVSVARNRLQAELVLDEILLDIRDRLLDYNRKDVSSIAEPDESLNNDIMLDPRVNISRHLSPVLSVKSIEAVASMSKSPLKLERRSSSCTDLLELPKLVPIHPNNPNPTTTNMI